MCRGPLSKSFFRSLLKVVLSVEFLLTGGYLYPALVGLLVKLFFVATLVQATVPTGRS
jgi:hypothetical protein